MTVERDAPARLAAGDRDGAAASEQGRSGGSTATAHVCMVIIGIGYLFPISAIWAAFDYWKLLFPDGNVEFSVAGVYQVGSVLTVAALSFSKSFAMGPRILGGFAGQFACLGVIFAFRWIALPKTLLFDLLLALVALCSVATGYLDSAMLSLCSQYSPKMQQHLQIGIGFGTFVSVVYRDSTKLLVPGDIAGATSFYFIVALITVLVCVACYQLLMSLPISAHISRADRCAGKERSSIETGDKVAPLLEERKVMQSSTSSDAGFRTVWSIAWKNQLVVCMNLVLTTLCYPGLLTSIPCRQLTALRVENWFQEVILTVFTLADMVGRFMTFQRLGLHHGNIQITLVVRVLVFPVVLFCIMSPLATDALSLAIAAVFGFLNGFCVSLSLIVINEIPQMSDEQRKTCGRISALSINGGLAIGSLAATALASSLGLSRGGHS